VRRSRRGRSPERGAAPFPPDGGERRQAGRGCRGGGGRVYRSTGRVTASPSHQAPEDDTDATRGAPLAVQGERPSPSPHRGASFSPWHLFLEARGSAESEYTSQRRGLRVMVRRPRWWCGGSRKGSRGSRQRHPRIGPVVCALVVKSQARYSASGVSRTRNATRYQKNVAMWSSGAGGPETSENSSWDGRKSPDGAGPFFAVDRICREACSVVSAEKLLAPCYKAGPDRIRGRKASCPVTNSWARVPLGGGRYRGSGHHSSSLGSTKAARAAVSSIFPAQLTGMSTSRCEHCPPSPAATRPLRGVDLWGVGHIPG